MKQAVMRNRYLIGGVWLGKLRRRSKEDKGGKRFKIGLLLDRYWSQSRLDFKLGRKHSGFKAMS